VRHTVHTTLSAAQEAIVLALRQSLYLPLDDLLFITKQYINADVSRSGIAVKTFVRRRLQSARKYPKTDRAVVEQQHVGLG
jgi:hypothetical protein